MSGFCLLAESADIPAGWTSLYVATDGSNANDGSSWASAKATVASAIVAAGAGNYVIQVGEGTFNETATVQLTNAVWVVGLGADKTILDFGDSVRGVRISSSSARLDSLCITKGSVNGDGGGINISNGEVWDCRITNCKARYYNGDGGGIYITGGLVSGCEIDNCYFDQLYGHGNGIHMLGGTVTNCNIHSNNGGYCHETPGFGSAGGVYMKDGLLVASRIHDNSKATIAGIHQEGGTIANCLIYANTGTSYGAAGLHKTAGNTYHSTFYGNIRSSDTEGNSGLLQTGGTTINCIFNGNYPSDNTLGGVKVSGGTFRTNVIDVVISYGTGIIASDAMLYDPENADFHVRMGSPAIGAGAELSGWPLDYDGVERGSPCDIGALEYVSSGGALTAAITASVSAIPEGGSATWTAALDGGDLDNLTFEWYMDGATKLLGSEISYTYTGAEIGSHTVTLVVRNGSGERVEATLDTPLMVYPLTVYVSQDGTGTWPYDTAAKATNNLSEAYAALWTSGSTTGTVHIASGTYACSGQLLLQYPVHVVGAGASETILDFQGASRGFQITHGAARVEALCISNGANSSDDGGGIYLASGKVLNCRITGCRTTYYNGDGGGIYITGGLVSGCEIDNCRFDQLYGHGNGIYMTDGTVTNCDIHANSGGYSHDVIGNASGGGVYMTGGLLVDSRVRDNSKTSVAGVEQRGGTVRNCQIYNNTDTAYGCAGVHKEGGTLRNSLIANNAGSGSGAGVYQTSGTMDFCTIAANARTGDTEGKSGLFMSGGTAVGNIIWGNGPGDTPAGGCYISGGTFNTNLTDTAVSTGTGNLVDDPIFRDFDEGDYRLSCASPCIDAGPLADWMTAAVDLDGVARLFHGHAPDLGCYECSIPGSTLIIMR